MLEDVWIKQGDYEDISSDLCDSVVVASSQSRDGGKILLNI